MVIQDWRVEFGEEVVETANFGMPGGAIKTSPIGCANGMGAGEIATSDKERQCAAPKGRLRKPTPRV